MSLRSGLLLLALLSSAAGLAGCVGNLGDEGEAKANDGTLSPATSGRSAAPPVTLLRPLVTSVSLEGPSWVERGASLTVAAAAPANGKAPYAYTWSWGALPGATSVTSLALNTSLIDPGASKALTFSAAGVYQMHCHPHPWMRHNVTVVDGLAGPKQVHVQIVDGEKPGEYRYVPEEVLVGVGTSVVYHNNGTMPHTSTQQAQSPPLSKLPLTSAQGQVAAQGDGWQRLMVHVQDSEGRLGSAEVPVYVTATLPKDYNETFTGTFPAGGLPAELVPPATHAFTLEHPGMIFLNFTVQDAAASANPEAPNLAEVEIHLQEDGQTQDTLTGEAAASGALMGRVRAGDYTLTIVPKGGAQLSYTLSVQVAYDLTPPPAAGPSQGGAAADPHAGH